MRVITAPPYSPTVHGVWRVFVQDNMSVVLVLFPNHTKAVPGYVVPSLAPDDDEQAKMDESAAQEAEINRRLTKLVAAQQGSYDAPGGAEAAPQ